ncbi:hypothetical protein [Bradyrhizobium sp. URHD0069]|nr:hypothetical protein [Bradyrhizobium sp. URHD0069]
MAEILQHAGESPATSTNFADIAGKIGAVAGPEDGKMAAGSHARYLLA